MPPSGEAVAVWDMGTGSRQLVFRPDLVGATHRTCSLHERERYGSARLARRRFGHPEPHPLGTTADDKNATASGGDAARFRRKLVSNRAAGLAETSMSAPVALVTEKRCLSSKRNRWVVVR